MTTTPPELPKLYSMYSIGLVTFFCSLLAGGYLLYANYKALGMRKLAHYTLAASVLVFALFLWAMSVYIDGTASGPDELPQALHVASHVPEGHQEARRPLPDHHARP